MTDKFLGSFKILVIILMNGLGMGIGKSITRIADHDILGYQIQDHTEEILKNGADEHT